MVLDRNPDNFFAETEQVAFCPPTSSPGIDFSNDPLLQGRLFSYQDTQLIAAGRRQLPPDPDQRSRSARSRTSSATATCRCDVPKGRANYEPNTLGLDGPREDPARGFTGFAEPAGERRCAPHPRRDLRRPLQPGAPVLRSQTEPEQNHIVSALVFEL